MRSFGFPLQPEEVRGVFETVKNVLPTGLHGQALTVSGFLLLHALFMERGAYESTWRVLRRFGYTNELTLSDELLEGVPFDHPSDQVSFSPLKALAMSVNSGTSVIGQSDRFFKSLVLEAR